MSPKFHHLNDLNGPTCPNSFHEVLRGHKTKSRSIITANKKSVINKIINKMLFSSREINLKDYKPKYQEDGSTTLNES